MNMNKLAITTALALSLATALADTTNTFNFSANQVVPDADANGLALEGNVSGLSGPIANVNVTLNLTNGFNGDLFAYLVGPNGGFAVLLNRVGVSNTPSAFGYGNAGFNITLSDSAANDVHYYQNFSPTFNSGGQLLNTWQTDGINIDPMTNTPSAFMTAGQTAMLASMDGVSADGNWTLFLADLSTGGTTTVANWGLVITIPEPSPIALALGGLVILLVFRRSRTAPSR